MNLEELGFISGQFLFVSNEALLVESRVRITSKKTQNMIGLRMDVELLSPLPSLQ
jgi:hypothetical protein